MTKLMAGKKGLIMGLANDRSLARPMMSPRLPAINLVMP